MTIPRTPRDLVRNPKFAPVLLILFLCACTSDSGSPVEADDKGKGTLGPNQGQFFDSPVEGLEFTSGDRSGTTDGGGVFSFEDGQDISFEIGDILLGTVPPRRKMNPLHLAGAADVMDPVATNIARFLQTIDHDGNPANGIVITAAVRAAAAGKTVNFVQETDAFENDANVQAVVASLTSRTQTGERTLVDAEAARSHLEAGIRNGFVGDYSGRYCKHVEGGGQSDGGVWAMRVASDGTLRVQFVGDVSFDVTCHMALDGSVFVNDPDAGVRLCGSFRPEFRGNWKSGEMTGTYSQRAVCSSAAPVAPGGDSSCGD